MTALSLFSGAGGFDLGLEAAGFDVLGCAERDRHCRETIAVNRPDWRLFDESDILELAPKLNPKALNLAVGELDLVAGGPPCQPFSTASQWSANGRRGMADSRADVIHAMLDIVDSLLPRALLIENVAGFLSGKNSARQVVEDHLSAINRRHSTSYSLQCTLVDAADYGVPQHRRRVLAVAMRDGQQWTAPSTTHDASPVTCWDALGDLPTPAKEDLPPAGTWTSLLPSIPEGSNYQYLTSQGGGPEIFGYRTRYWSFLLKLAKDRPSWTLPASPGPSTGPFHWDNRPLSVRERMRLQSFPDDWKISGPLREQIRQAGNATPPLLAEVAGLQLRRLMNGGEANASRRTFKHLRPKVAALAPPCPALADIPDSFVLNVGVKTAHPGVGLGPGALGRVSIK